MSQRSKRKQEREMRRTINEGAGLVTSIVALFIGYSMFTTATIYDPLTQQFGIYALVVVVFVAMMGGIVVGGLFSGILSSILIKNVPAAKADTSFMFDDMPLTSLSPTDFEREVARLIENLTRRKTVVCGGKGDGGIDIKVYGAQGDLVGIVQCKRLSSHKLVPPAHIRELNTVKHQSQVNTAYLVTTGRFSPDSLELGKKLGIRLIGGEELQKMRSKANTIVAEK